MGQLQALILDLEGTLYSSGALTAAYDAEIRKLLAAKRETSEQSAGILIEEKREELAVHLGFRPPVVTTVEALGIGREILYQAIGRVDPKRYLRSRPRLPELIGRLASRYKLAILTDTSTCQAQRVIDRLGIDRSKFRIVLGGDRVAHLKPHSEPFTTIAEFLRADHPECVSVGDRIEIDLVPAKKLGMRTVLVGPSRVRSQFVDIVIGNLMQIERALSRLGDL